MNDQERDILKQDAIASAVIIGFAALLTIIATAVAWLVA